MNKRLLRLILTNVCAISIILLFVALFQGVSYSVNDNTYQKNYANVIKVIEYETIETFDKSLPNNIKKTLVNGKNGLFYIKKDGMTVTLEEKIDEQVLVGTGKYGIYSGYMTGYGPDCTTCDGIGFVACNTKDNKDFNIIRDGVYYNDSEYGSVRVLAADLSGFPCGTIIEISNSPLDSFTGIVMDTGYMMRKFYSNNKILFDVAYDTEENYMVPRTTDMSGNVAYNVQRWGW